MKSKTNKKAESKKQKNVVVEIPLPDGWMSMFVGRLVKRSDKEIILDDASWISSTGRRNEFFAGKFDSNCEIEPYPDGTHISLPAVGAVLTDWNHDLPRTVK